MSEEKKTPSWVVILTSVLSLIGVIATAYFGYLQVREKSGKNETPVLPEIPAPDVEYSLNKFSGANFRIGNTGSKGIIIVSDLTLQWDYSECSQFQEPRVGAPLITYSYTAEITKSRDSKLLDNRQFKYAPGEVDDFNVKIKYPGLGIYQVWLEFKYKWLGEKEFKLFQTEKRSTEFCEK